MIRNSTALIAAATAGLVAAVLMIGIALMLSRGPAVTAGTAAGPVTVGATVAGTYISEDDPRFDCRTMGDRHCGPDIVNGPFNPGATLDPAQVTDIRH